MRMSTWVTSGSRGGWVGRWKRSPSSALRSKGGSEDSDTSPSPPLLLVAALPCRCWELADDREEELRRALLVLLLVG